MMPKVVIDGRPAQGRPRGMGVYTRQLVSALASLARNVELHVALDEKAGQDPWPESLTVGRLWGRSGNPATWEQSVLPKLAQQHHATLIHHTANQASFRPHTPYIVTIHDAIFMRGLSAATETFYPGQILSYCYYRFGVPCAAARAELVLTDSDYSRKQLMDKLQLAPEKIKTVHLGGPTSSVAEDAPDPDTLLQQYKITKPYFLGLGAIDPRKNTANLVRAFARIPRSAAEMLVLAGFEKSQHSTVPELINCLGLEQRVRILDFIPEQDLMMLYKNASAFAYPSRDEGFGLPILQAFQLGVPVVTSPVGSIPEVAGQAALFADPEDPQSIAQALIAIVSSTEEAHRLAMAGYIQAKQFHWDKTAQATLEAYDMVLKKILK